MAILDHIEKHIQLTEEEKQFFLSLLKSTTLKKNQYLLKAGAICRTENFIVQGCMRTFTIDEKGTEHSVMFAIENWWTGDLHSFLSEKPSIYNVEAVEDTELVQISKKALEQLYSTVPKFERYFRILLQNAFIAQQERINQNLALSAEQRYDLFLKTYPSLEQRLSQKQIATYLGITPVFLSMLRKKKTQSQKLK